MSEAPSDPAARNSGRNGTYVVFRKLHQRVAAFRQYLKANSSSREEEEWLAAKMMGRWRSGAPLALCPMHDDAELGEDPQRNNAFLFKEDDPIGYKTPCGSHRARLQSPAIPAQPLLNLALHPLRLKIVVFTRAAHTPTEGYHRPWQSPR
jgi:deferrochelatase/peroxidase EfeB